MGRQSSPAAAARRMVVVVCAAMVVVAAAAQKYNAVYNFGDSITDTGNLCTNGKPSQITFTQPPYGETYFGSPTCRCSDGRVVVDFLASKFGLPFLPPSKSTSADFKKGANMAITGATAMDANFFRSLGLSDKIWNNGPISFQIQWFQQISSSVCGQNCKSYLANSLFVFGEFGGNDYNAMLFGGYSADQASTYTPQIVDTISNGVEKLIAMGAVDVVVPGVLPIGCFPIYLTIYGTSSSSDYDSLGCLKKFNDLSTNHNNQLKTKISALQSKYKSARIMYADFYSGVYDMVRNPSNYGTFFTHTTIHTQNKGSFGITLTPNSNLFRAEAMLNDRDFFSEVSRVDSYCYRRTKDYPYVATTVFETCCGSGGGKFNYNNNARCGMSGASACSNPASHLSWDGIHLTEAAYKQITDGWLNGPYCSPAILHS
uniref:Esterase n=1 Tax=Oryza punctata TaxID=4537 RepID=A0A0E0L839_ORYPU